jgi:hypothetical protein
LMATIYMQLIPGVKGKNGPGQHPEGFALERVILLLGPGVILRWLAGGLGFEPRSATPKAAVLPLDDPPG